MHINLLARKLLISKEGVFTKYAASGCKETKKTILTRSLTSVTYSSLCIPDDIAERGLEDIPNFYYRDDGLQLWDIIFRFVKGVLSSYYKDDAAVQKDSELQKWIGDIFKYGFLSQASTGIPHQFDAVDDLIKFVTMVMFTCSCQHGAVNTGQYDYGAWMPNNPTSLQLPPPTTKGTTTEATLLETLPDVNTTVNGMAVMWLLSQQSSDFVPLGQYPQEHFFEETPCKLITKYQGELKKLSAAIEVFHTLLSLRTRQSAFICGSSVVKQSLLMQQLDHHSTRLMTIFKRKGGAAGRKIRNIMVDLDKNEAVETRRACVLKALMVYFNEDPENLIREYMWKAGVDPCPTSPCRRRTLSPFFL
ncbi:arachidonate 15-lipoxygenase B-like [Solea senegalensis]|uniref:Arachidonate 15-lipoxygenase B-like n=1 Tax=Solea senegalensis TaxID=28829 RepID=A0AAV6PD82_SOLSE|nr:arachidonate 15-lipoxygenase B-like [Solea senegalensis]